MNPLRATDILLRQVQAPKNRVVHRIDRSKVMSGIKFSDWVILLRGVEPTSQEVGALRLTRLGQEAQHRCFDGPPDDTAAEQKGVNLANTVIHPDNEHAHYAE
jgi:hypothetical protein